MGGYGDWLQVSDVGGLVKDLQLRLTGRLDREHTPSYRPVMSLSISKVDLQGGPKIWHTFWHTSMVRTKFQIFSLPESGENL